MTRIEQSQALAAAFRQQDEAEIALLRAKIEVAEAFISWAAGRSINRDKAREQLISTGLL